MQQQASSFPFQSSAFGLSDDAARLRVDMCAQLHSARGSACEIFSRLRDSEGAAAQRAQREFQMNYYG